MPPDSEYIDESCCSWSLVDICVPALTEQVDIASFLRAEAPAALSRLRQHRPDIVGNHSEDDDVLVLAGVRSVTHE